MKLIGTKCERCGDDNSSHLAVIHIIDGDKGHLLCLTCGMELLNEVQSKRCGTSDEREKAWQEYKKYGLDNEDNKQLAREAFNAGWDACMKVKHEI